MQFINFNSFFVYLININYKSIQMKKIFFFLFISSSSVIIAQKSAGLMSQEDVLSKNIAKMHDAYESANFNFWDQMISPDAIIYLNNIKMDYKTMRPLFASHHTIFNNIKIEDRYQHTNYFKEGEIWTNSWFTWIGTGNKTGIRYSNVAHLDWKWEKGKVIQMQFYFDPTGLNLETGNLIK